MVKCLAMVNGEKLCLNRPVVQWRMFSEKDPAIVVMIASVEAEPTIPTSAVEPDLSVLAVEMTPQVAMRLHEQLGEFGRLNGWLA
jgi:hypothetical protein